MNKKDSQKNNITQSTDYKTIFSIPLGSHHVLTCNLLPYTRIFAVMRYMALHNFLGCRVEILLSAVVTGR
jgi:hypothetical protein